MSEPTFEYRARSEYYAARAIAEHRRVDTATDPRAAAVHGELAARYEALASDPRMDLSVMDQPDEQPPVLRSATG